MEYKHGSFKTRQVADEFDVHKDSYKDKSEGQKCAMKALENIIRLIQRNKTLGRYGSDITSRGHVTYPRNSGKSS